LAEAALGLTGMAADIDFYDSKGNKIGADTIRAKIFEDLALFPFIRCIETGVSWVHIDVMGEEDSPKRTGCDTKKVMLFDTQNRVSWIERKELAA